MSENIVHGHPVSATNTLIYEPVLHSGNYIVTVKYKYNVNVVMDGAQPYITIINRKVFSNTLLSEEDVDRFISEQMIRIHNNFRAAVVQSIDVVQKV